MLPGVWRPWLGAWIGGALAILVVFGGAFSVPASGAAVPSAAALLRTALRDGSTRGSMHEIQGNRFAGLSVALTADVAQHDGRQQIAAPSIGTAKILVVGGDAYCSGTTLDALPNYCGVSPAAARIVGKR
jgi:hypothetical protein